MERKWRLGRRDRQRLLCIQHLERARPGREVGWKVWNPHGPAGYPGKSSRQHSVNFPDALSLQLQFCLPS